MIIKNLRGLATICLFYALVVWEHVSCGRIYGTDIKVTYPIATQATTYKFKILFETILKSGDYLRIKWPYQLEYLVGTSEVKAKIVNTDLSISTQTPSLTIIDSIYHFAFPVDLPPYHWYVVTITGVINEQNPQTVGFQNLIQIATVTSTLSNAQVIDNNPAFGTFVLSDSPPDTVKITATYTSASTLSQRYAPGSSYEIQMIIKTTQSVSSYDADNPSGVIYEIDMTDASFSFVSPVVCTFLNRETGVCTCALGTGVFWKLIVTCSQDLVVSNSSSYSPIKFTVDVTNSMQLVQNTQGFSVKLIYPPTSLIVETGTNAKFFEVNQIGIKNMKLKLMHGIPYSSGFATTFEAPLGIYIPTSLTPRFQPFNSVRVEFETSQDTSLTTALQIIGIYNSAEAILESSIVNNFPQFDPLVKVKCSFDFTAKTVTCNGVGQLIASTVYFLAARVALTSSATITTNTDGTFQISNFGGIQIKSILMDSTGATFLGVVTTIIYPTSSIPVYKQTEYIDSTGTHSLMNFGSNIVVTGPTSGTFSVALNSNLGNSAKIGIIPSTSNSRLIFYVNVQQQQQTFQNFLGYSQTSYMKMIYNDNVIEIDSTDLPKGVEILSTATTVGYFSDYGTSSTKNCILQQKDLLGANLFKYAYVKISTQRAMLGGSNLGFGLQNVKFPASFKSSQFVADDRVLDFLLFFMHKDTSSTAPNQLVMTTSMLIHGYTVYSSYVNSAYEVAYSNLYLKNLDVNNGYKIPTLLRLFGTLSSLEIGTTASDLKLAVIPDRSVAKFFAVNQFSFDATTTTLQGCGGTTQSCYSYDDGQSSKINSPSDNWSLNPFILLDLASVTTEISQAIAVLLKPKRVPRTINLAIVSYTANGSLEVYNVVRVYGAALSLTAFATDKRYLSDILALPSSTNAWNQVSAYSENTGTMASTYKISSLSAIAPSTTAASFLFLSTHTDSGSLVTVNTLASLKLGSGFTIASYKSDLFGAATISGFPGVTAVKKCIQKFQYNVSTLTDPYFNSVAFCPYDNSAYTDGAAGQGVTFSSMTFSNAWGALYPLKGAFTYSWSSNIGQLIDLKLESQSTLATSKAIACTATTWSPAYYLSLPRQQTSIIVKPSVLATLTSQSDLYQIQMTFDAFPTGVSFASQCSAVTALHPGHYVTEEYTTCEARQTASNVISFFITKVSDEDGITVTFGVAEQFFLYFYVTHQGTISTTQLQSVVIIYNTYVQDDCNSVTPTNVAAGTAAPVTTTTGMLIDNFVIDNPTAGGNTRVMWDFNYVDRVSIPDTTLRFKLGFMSTPKMLSNLDCQVLEYVTYHDYAYEGVDNGATIGYMPSSKFSTVLYNSLVNSIDVTMRGSYAAPTDPYRMECYGFKGPNADNTDPISVSWIDTENSNTVIQKSFSNILYSLGTYRTAKTLSSSQFKLVSKKFNSPGYSAVYTFSILPKNVRMTINSRIYVEFSSAYLRTLLRKGDTPQCSLNSLEVTCLQYPDQARRIIIYPIPLGQTVLEPSVTYTLVIAGILQPQALDSYGKIWLGIDADRTFSNGIQEQGDVADIAISTALPTYLSNPSLSYSTYKIRQPRVMLNLECTFYRIGDATRTNLTTSCQRVYGNSYIQMNLTADSYNTKNSASYWIQVFYLPSPDYVNPNTFPLYVNFFITGQSQSTVLFSISPSMTKTPVPISFEKPTTQTKTLMWYTFDNGPLAQTKVKLFQQYTGRERHVYTQSYRGMISSEILYLSFEQTTMRFNTDFSFTFTNATVFKLFDIFVGRQKLTSSTVKINTGDDGVKIAIAAKQSTPLGTYTLALAKVGVFTPFEDPDISPLPNLVINTQDFYCPLFLSDLTKNVVRGERAGPFTLDFDGCLPSEGAIITAEFDPTPATSTEIYLESLSKQIVGYTSQTSAVYYLYVDVSVTVGTVYKLKVIVSGINNKQYYLQDNIITLTVTAGPSSSADVTVSGHSQSLSTDQTTLTMKTTCSQNGYIYWAIGVSEQYLNSEKFVVPIPFATIKQATIFQLPSADAYLNDILISKRYKSFLWQGDSLDSEQKYLARAFGYAAVTAATEITMKFLNLPQRSIYSISYYCESTYHKVSTVTQSDWTTSWTLSPLGVKIKNFDHIRIDLSFNKELSSNQVNNLLCQLQEHFAVNLFSFSQITCAMCDTSKSYNYTEATYQDMNTSNTVCPISTSGSKVYSFYAWSGEQSTGLVEDMNTYIRSLYTLVPCLFVQIVNYSLDLDLIEAFTNQVTLTTIAPTATLNIQPIADIKSFETNVSNSTLTITNTNSDAFLIFGVYHFTNNGQTTLSQIPQQPSPLQLRQGYLGDDTQFNLHHSVQFVTAGTTTAISVDMVDSEEYAVYWTFASIESCGDSLYSPIGFKQFFFKSPVSFSNQLRFAIQNIMILIALVVLPTIFF